jgi:ubiquinone biosynthesis monooxygenase Coq7
LFCFYLKTIKKFRDDETEHHDTGLANNAEQVKDNFLFFCSIICFLFKAPFYRNLTSVIKMGCRMGIYIAERI